MRQRAVIGRDSRLLAVQGVAVLPDGAVLVADRLDYRVKKFAASGEQRGAVGGRGKGPGLFQGPGPLDFRGNRIAVADFATGRVQYLRDDFTPSLSFEVPGAVSDLCFDGTGNLWVMAVTMDKQRGLFLYGADGKERKTLGLRNGEGDLFFDAGFVAWLGKGMIAVAYYLRNKIELWDTSGRFIREFAVPGLPDRAHTRRVSGSKSGTMVPDGNIVRSMTADGHGRLYVLGADYSLRPGEEVLELDGEGRLQRRLWLREKSVLIRADGKGSLYVVPGDRRSVVRYHLGEG
jgi:sugar lactone lactonase YvrE